ncbi:ParB/Srx family N-terminal domain-containing protein [Cellulomonas alba]|uniref:ParB/Srx family N-terminal domain-containing protein n=1 Tax=Cellulomonas alba TaxID=3053467 RepID=A0ABT7SI58_9CELL|nr:ParB/Srx family N-terminal domain-containing protein [Cellulomonas alba]MDM7855224.1 ParB/Srx family N-terminal domain-containing protein [Cellulomonas alba]
MTMLDQLRAARHRHGARRPAPRPDPRPARPVRPAPRPGPAVPAALHQVVRTTYDRRQLSTLLASDHGHRPLRELTEHDVRLPGEDEHHMAEVVASIRRHGLREPLLVRVRPNGERVLIDGHHRAVAVLREHLADRVPVIAVSCPCTMGCAVMWRELQTLHDHAVADGWA